MRVAYGSSRGDLRWRGRIPCIDNGRYEWAGVEWDPGADAEAHGRHDGTLRGQRYFHCERVPPRASFVRTDHVQFPQSLGVALAEKYGTGNEAHEDCFPTRSKDRARSDTSVTLATLTRAGVAWDPNEQERLSTRFGDSLRYLDVSYGLIEFYEDIAELLQTFSKLEELDISGNRLRFRNAPSDASTPSRPAVRWASRSLRILRCNHIGLDLAVAAVASLVAECVVLEELRLHGNRVRLEPDAIVPPAFPDSLIRLFLGANELRELNRMPTPHLQALDLSENLDFRAIRPLDANTSFAPHLQFLNLNHTSFVDLEVLASAFHFPQLKALRLGHLPREQIIARIPSLVKLNGSEISPEERRDAELRFSANWMTHIDSALVSEPLLLRVNALRHRYGVQASLTSSLGAHQSCGERQRVSVLLVWFVSDRLPTNLNADSIRGRQHVQLPGQTPWWLLLRIAQAQTQWVPDLENGALTPGNASVYLCYASENGFQPQDEVELIDVLENLKPTEDGQLYVLIGPKRCCVCSKPLASPVPIY